MSNQPLDAEIEEAVAQTRPPATGGLRELVDNRWLVLGLLFFVTAALGLPVLWASRGFSFAGKVVVTLAVLVWTALVLWVFGLIMIWCYGQILQAS